MKRVALGLGLTAVGGLLLIVSWLGDVMAALDEGDLWS